MIPAINEENGEMVHLDEKDILFFLVKKGNTYYHTWKGTFRRIKGANEYEKVFTPFGFKKVDRNTIAQMDLITRYDPLLRIAYFDNPDFPTQACYVSTEVGKIINKKLKK